MQFHCQGHFQGGDTMRATNLQSHWSDLPIDIQAYHTTSSGGIML